MLHTLRPIPSVHQLEPTQQCPVKHKSPLSGRQTPTEHFQGLDPDFDLMITVIGVKVGWQVVGVVDLDNNATEPAEFRHSLSELALPASNRLWTRR